MAKDIILTLKNITKEFPGVKALDDVTISVERGTIHGLVGENGVIHGLDHFGYSAPYKVLDEKFGYNGATVAAEVKKMLGK